MNTSKKLTFFVVLLAFLALVPAAGASADTGRYFIKSTKKFWKNALGVRHDFSNGFSADLSDIQVRFAKIFGVEIEPVSTLQILPADPGPSQSPVITPDPVKKDANSGASDKGKNIKPTIRPAPSDQTPWGIETVYNNPVIASTSGGLDINVAVLDTGVNTAHPDLARRVVQCKDFTNFKTAVIDGKCEDKNGHGTHVAGIVAADAGVDGKGIYGVAPAASIWAYKVCGPNGSCYADDIAGSLRLAADQGAHIINMSFGSDKNDDLVRQAVDYAYGKGVLLVAAAGNDGPFPDSIDYPAALANVVAVGALNQSLTVADWSSRGTNAVSKPFIVEHRDIEFAAPGEHIESAWNEGGYIVLSGTSMASPFVAGLAAKSWQSAATDPRGATIELLRLKAIDLVPAGDDDTSGFGLPHL